MDDAPLPLALTVAEAGHLLGVSSDTIRRLIRSGKLPHARIGNSIRLRRVDVEAYLEGQTSRDWHPVDGRGGGRAEKMSET